MTKSERYEIREKVFRQLEQGLKPNAEYIAHELSRGCTLADERTITNVVKEAIRAKEKIDNG